MKQGFDAFYSTLAREADPWAALQAVQNYVTRALAWAFADRLQFTGSFQHTLLPDFYVHLHPGPSLAVHMRLDPYSVEQLLTSLSKRRSSDFKHIVLVRGAGSGTTISAESHKLALKNSILVTSFDLIDEILRIVDIIEARGVYLSGVRLRGLQRRLERWCLDSAGWIDSPRLETLLPGLSLGLQGKHLKERSGTVCIWVQNKNSETADPYISYLRDSTSLAVRKVQVKDASDVNRQQNHRYERVQRIFELATPTVLLSYVKEHIHVPILAVVMTKHAPMGQNVYQVLPQALAAAQAGIPFFLVAPEKSIVTRQSGNPSIEQAHPLLFQALVRMSGIYKVPCLFLPWPTEEDRLGLPLLRYDRKHVTMPDRANAALQLLFKSVDLALDVAPEADPAQVLLGYHGIIRRRLEMDESRFRLGTRALEEPSRGSGMLLPTKDMKQYISRSVESEILPRLPRDLHRRPTTLVMTTNSKTFRAPPYLGTLLAFDFAFCRNGPKPTDRSTSLFAHFRQVALADALSKLFLDGNLDSPRGNREALFLQYSDALLFRDGLLVKNGTHWEAYSTEQAQ